MGRGVYLVMTSQGSTETPRSDDIIYGRPLKYCCIIFTIDASSSFYRKLANLPQSLCRPSPICRDSFPHRPPLSLRSLSGLDNKLWGGKPTWGKSHHTVLFLRGTSLIRNIKISMLQPFRSPNIQGELPSSFIPPRQRHHGSGIGIIIISIIFIFYLSGQPRVWGSSIMLASIL